MLICAGRNCLPTNRWIISDEITGQRLIVSQLFVNDCHGCDLPPPPNDGAPGCPLDSVRHFSSTDLNASLFCLRRIVKLFRIGHCIIDLGVSFIGTKRLKCSAGHSGLAACILDHNLQWRNNSQILFPSIFVSCSDEDQSTETVAWQ